MTRILIIVLLLACSIPVYAQVEYYEYKNNGDYHILEVNYDKNAFVYRAYTTKRNGYDPCFFPAGYLEICGFSEVVDSGLKLYKHDYMYISGHHSFNYTKNREYGEFKRQLWEWSDGDQVNLIGGMWDYSVFFDELVMFDVRFDNDGKCTIDIEKFRSSDRFPGQARLTELTRLKYPFLEKTTRQQLDIKEFPKLFHSLIRERENMMDDDYMFRWWYLGDYWDAYKKALFDSDYSFVISQHSVSIYYPMWSDIVIETYNKKAIQAHFERNYRLLSKH